MLGSGGSAAMCHGYSVFVCYHALAVFVVFSLDCPVFMLSGVMYNRLNKAGYYNYTKDSVHCTFSLFLISQTTLSCSIYAGNEVGGWVSVG